MPIWNLNPRVAGFQFRLGALFCFLIAAIVAGCRSVPPLPPIDLSAPGWRVQSGQAIWKPPGDRPELAGNLLLATNANGNFFVQLTKDPFPLVTAESVDGQWQIEFDAAGHFWCGHGEPPARFVWFLFPRALLGANIAGNWHFEAVPTNSWRLDNSQTRETLEGGFYP
jgi:hypothetical protein